MKTIKIEVCIGTSSHLLGSEDILEVINSLPPMMRQYVEMSGMSCLSQCGKGPNVRIDGILYSGITPQKIRSIIIDNLKSEE